VSYGNFREVSERLAAMVGDIDPESAKGKKRRQILEAATELFVSQGYRKTNIDEIARAAGIAKGTVYLYFSTKAEVLLAVVAHEKLRSMALLEGVFDASLPARERLRHWVLVTLRMVASSPVLARLTEGDQDFRAALAELDPALVASTNAEHQELLEQLLDEAAHPRRWSAAERQERTAVIDGLAFLAPVIRKEHVRKGLSIERFTEVMASTFVDGLLPPGEAEPDRSGKGEGKGSATAAGKGKGGGGAKSAT